MGLGSRGCHLSLGWRPQEYGRPAIRGTQWQQGLGAMDADSNLGCSPLEVIPYQPGYSRPVTPPSTGLVMCVCLGWLPFWVIISDSSAGIQLRGLGPTPCLV